MTNVARYARAGAVFVPPSSRRWIALLGLLLACSANPAAEEEEPDCRDDCACDSTAPGCKPTKDAAAGSRPASRDAGLGAPTGSTKVEDGGAESGANPRPDAATTPSSRAADTGVDQPSDAAAADSNASTGDGSTPKADAASEAGTGSTGAGFVTRHGPLHVEGNRVVDRDNLPVQLRGMSLFWSQWSTFYTAKSVDVLVDDWKATVVRAALGVENDDGYLTAPADNVAKVRAVVDRAIARDIYVVIDWHDHHAQDHVAQATTFFEEMAKAYGKQPHVIFEIYNEPMNTTWSVVKTYAEQMIGKIRNAGADNMIIVGTPNWSQDVDVAAQDRITSDKNVAYTLHFYAATHKQELRDKAKAALDRGIALFVTEWGTCAADGNGAVDEAETRTWLSFLQSRNISWANWALNDKAEACSAIKAGAGAFGPWRADQLTQSGLLVKNAIP
jgi:endoglucanase